ncbi:hypothetical protein [Rhodopseudomonas pseudopalustris]|uniref:Uncharacterized protein n=1 Tax=Rhodopseudomonas pseudopalustris TaxID=1513892 RepID=A0A1H8VA22_9BRAD|nr:hypothetical protein [Rhodopseudomonas pseudopalustris]SEP12270.1 hypothetical protein SAMN05444123_108153 [Rhodopseudomonas pseudopalustris]
MITRFLSDVGDLIKNVTADLFWNFVTSTPVLVALGVVMLAAAFVAHLPLIGRLVPAVNTYQRFADIVEIVAAAVLMFLIGFSVADQRAELARVKDELTFKTFQLESAAATAADAERLRKGAEAETAAAKGKLDDYCKTFGCGDDRKVAAAKGVRVVRKCVPPPGYFEWLRQLQRRGAAAGRA